MQRRAGRTYIHAGWGGINRMLKGIGYFLLLLIVIAAGLIVTAPMLMNWAIPEYLETQGISAEFRFGRPGLSNMTIHSARIETRSMEVEADDLLVRYRLASLLKGRVSNIAVARLNVLMMPSEDTGDTIDIPSPWLLIPADRVRVDELRIENTEPVATLQGNFEFDTDRARAYLLIDSPMLPTSLDALVQLDPLGGIDVTLTRPGAPAALQLNGKPEDDVIFIEGTINLVDETFMLLANIALLGDLSGHLQGNFSATAPWPLSTTMDAGSVTANGTFDYNVSGNLPEIERVSLTGDLTTSLASGTLQFKADQIIARAGAITVAGATYHLGEDSRLDMALNGSLPARSLAGDFLPRLNVTLQTDMDVSLSSEAEAAITRHTAVTGKMTTTLAAGEVVTKIDRNATLDMAFPTHDMGLKVKQPFDMRWNTQTGVIDTADASLQVRLPEIEWLGQRLAFRDARADITSLKMDGNALDMNGRVRTNDSAKAVPLDFVVDANLAKLSGSFEISTKHAVSRALLESELPGWVSDYDLDGGKVDLSVDGQFHETAVGMDIAGKGQARLTDAVAHYGGSVASGLDATLPISINGGAWRAGPGLVDIGQVDVGFPLTDVRFNIDTDGETVNFSDVSADVLAGRVQVDEFDYDIENQAGRFDAVVRDVSVAAILALASEDADGSGRLDGVLPVTLRPEGPTIDGGRLTAQPPGGHLNYGGAVPAANPGLNLAIRALRNFQYDHMTLDVDYVPEGQLDLMVRLEGKNPDVEDGRPIHFNLNISQNVLTLLKSLQASERMSERVQERLSR